MEDKGPDENDEDDEGRLASGKWMNFRKKGGGGLVISNSFHFVMNFRKNKKHSFPKRGRGVWGLGGLRSFGVFSFLEIHPFSRYQASLRMIKYVKDGDGKDDDVKDDGW